ncbi:hypothetical protein [uncultured Alistipes sp.]|uniref:hypothetical protein n=1 Tax=uncultured Alistipes sp. TaxID=538949 RepID=UPI0025F946D5|nr:hypothetical protein [uncultured Alistipes sp.]
MRKISFFAGAALMLALLNTGCSKDQIEDKGPGTTPEGPVEGGIQLLTVSVPQAGGPESRASFGNEYDGVLPLVWDAGDKIVAYETAGEHATGHVYQLVGEGGTGSGSFEYAGEQTAPGSIAEIYYPESLAATDFVIPAQQTYTAGSFDAAAKVMRAEVADPSQPVVFESLSSVACLRLTGNGEQVTAVRVELTPAVGTAKSYTLSCPEAVVLSATPTLFYVVVDGSTEAYSAAFTVSVDGKESMLQKTSAPKTFAPATVVRFPVLAYAKNLYQVMDYWPNDTNPEGIVFQVSNGGLNGKVLSHQHVEGNWGKTISEVTAGVAAMRVEPENGKLVTQQLIELHKNEADFAASYPLFEWILNTKNGGDVYGPWYAPSRPELRQLYFVMCDVNPADYSSWYATVDKTPMPGFDSDDAKAARTAFKNKNDGIAGADALNIYGRLYSTWENAAGGSVWALQIDKGTFEVMTKTGGVYSRIRPVRQF